MPAPLPPRPAVQTPAQAQGRAVAAKQREDQLRQQAVVIADRAKVDQAVAKGKQSEIDRLKKAVEKCADAYKRAKEAFIRFRSLPVPQGVNRAVHEQQGRKIAEAQSAALNALNAARAALDKAMREAAAVAGSPAQQALPVVQKALEAAKQDTQREAAVAVQVGVPKAALPPAPTPAQVQVDVKVAEVAKDAPAVTEKTVAVADAAANAGSKAVVAADAPPPPPATEAPPPAVVEDAAKAAEAAVDGAVGPKSGFPLVPALAIAGIAFLIMRKRT
jgi:hypothetical protein